MKLSILIPTTASRKAYLDDLLSHLYTQIGGTVTTTQAGQLIRHNLTDVEILVDPCESCRIGEKRNRLLDYAHGEYLCFFDDDDTPGENYIAVLMAGIASGADCVSLRGIMTIDGANPETFEHSLKYPRWETVNAPIKYLRPPNHLNCIKSFYAKKIKFPHKNWGEDREWSEKLARRGYLQTEYYSDEVIYYYKYRSKK